MTDTTTDAPQDPHHRRRQSVRRRHHHGLRRHLPDYPGQRYEDWELEDPAGKGVESVRPIRDEIRNRVLTLLGEVGVAKVEA